MTGVVAQASSPRMERGEPVYYYWFYFGQRAVEDSL